MDSKESGGIQKIKEELTAIFLMVDMDPINFYLGLKVKLKHCQKIIIKLF